MKDEIRAIDGFIDDVNFSISQDRKNYKRWGGDYYLEDIKRKVKDREGYEQERERLVEILRKSRLVGDELLSVKRSMTSDKFR